MNKFSASLVAALFAAACLDASAADPAKPACVQPDVAAAKARSDAEPRGQAPTTDGTAAASYAKTSDPNSGMPNRISMNVTVPKQTQGATFGEKVNQGLHSAAGAVAQGAPAASGAVADCDDAGVARVKEKTGASDASAGKGAKDRAAPAEAPPPAR